jgi:hypothetical protein
MPSYTARLLVEAMCKEKVRLSPRHIEPTDEHCHISYELGKETVWSRVTAELTKEPRAKNHRPIRFYLILLRVAKPFDVFERVEFNKRKRTSENEPIEYARRCIKGAVRNMLWCL